MYTEHVDPGICSRLCLNLFSSSETAVRYLNGRRLYSLQIEDFLVESVGKITAGLRQ
jgi:hypothetical protein